MSIIKINELSKSYGELRAVDGISFEVREGELFAFLGVNGVGKSTTINIMCGQLEKDGGEVEIDGYTLENGAVHIKERLGDIKRHFDHAGCCGKDGCDCKVEEKIVIEEE